MPTPFLLFLSAAALAALPVFAQTQYPAVLAGHAVLPAMTLIPAPADAPGRRLTWRAVTETLVT